MKVSELPYERVTIERMRDEISTIISLIGHAKTAEDVLEARKRYNAVCDEYNTANALSYMRYTINTVDEFYLHEKDYYDEISPEVANLDLAYNTAFMNSPFLPELKKILNPLLFQSIESVFKKCYILIVN